ncbi:ABC transporter permease subunit [Pseudomonas sp. UBA4194]|uniref:ABC transporter permease subunit n=1 Tax=Pseudomonas sp. UBA4194 TaxID=1947317 RepID=UPI0025DE0AC2|nr:ABC transporter permease subunit [Pseudomonas sp. UBA4194]
MTQATLEVGLAQASMRRPFRLKPWMMVLPAVLFLMLLMVYPVAEFLGLSIVRKGELSLYNYDRLLSRDIYWRVLVITLQCAGWTTLFAVLFGYPVAYLIATTQNKTRARLMFWLMLPFWTSFLVRTFAWIVLLGRNGLFNQWLQAVGLTDAPAELLYNFSAVMIGMLHALMPLCVITMLSVLDNIDANLSRASMTLGAPPGSTFWRIYFPLSMPGVAAGGLLVFITALGFFITPALLGSPRDIMLPQLIIQQVQEMLNWEFAGALSVLLLVAVLVVFLVYDRVFGMSTLAGGAHTPSKAGGSRLLSRVGNVILAALGRASDLLIRLLSPLAGTSPTRRRRPVGRWCLWLVVLVILFFLVAPAFVMVPISFTETSVLDWPPKGFSWQWYEAYLESPAWVAATLRSVQVALLTALLSMLIGTPAAFGLMRGLKRGNALVLAFLLSPLILPRIVIAVALFYLFSKLALIGSVTGLVLGHTILAVPYVVVSVMAVLKNYDQRYDNAAWSLGANRWRALRYVTLPLLRGGLLAAFLFAFVTSFDELTLSLFVSGGMQATLPKQMWDSAILQVNPLLSAVSTLLLALIAVVLLLANRLSSRDSQRQLK